MAKTDIFIPKNESNNNQVPPKRVPSKQTIVNLVIFALSEFLGGLTFSLLAPFYTQEATDKGLSVAQTGLVYGSAFLTTIVFSPIFGKYIETIGSRSLFLYGTFIAGSTNVLFGCLQWVDGTVSFLALSFSIRMLCAVGESAFFSSIYPLAAQAVDSSRRSTVLSVMETMFGLGMMIGPFIGALFYEVGGFYLPFVICGVLLMLCTLLANFILKIDITDRSDDEASQNTPFTKLLKMPSVIGSCLLLCVSNASVSWYLPSLQPFLESQFNLGSLTIGAIFMLEGASYAMFSPFWGWLLDKHCSPITAFYAGTVASIIGYCLLGPAPFLTFLQPSLYLVIIGMFVFGFGVAAIYISTLTYMLTDSVRRGAPDTEQTKGMITSLWFINECIGGYLGSSLGGLAFDHFGFESGTLFVIAFQCLALVFIPVLKCFARVPQKQGLLRGGRRQTYQSLA